MRTQNSKSLCANTNKFGSKQINELVEKVFRDNRFVPVDECEMLHEFDDCPFRNSQKPDAQELVMFLIKKAFEKKPESEG